MSGNNSPNNRDSRHNGSNLSMGMTNRQAHIVGSTHSKAQALSSAKPNSTKSKSYKIFDRFCND